MPPLVRQSLVPTIPSHRLVAVGDALAWRLTLLLWGLIAVWVLDQVWGLADRVVFTPYQMTVLRSTIVSILYSGFLIALLMPIKSGARAQNGSDVRWPAWLFWSVAISAGFLIMAVLLGYPELARFVGAHLVSTAGVLWLMYLLHLVAESISSVSVISGRQIEDDAVPEDEADAPSLLTIRIIVGLLMDIVLVLVGITILLLLWRFDWVEVKGWIQAAFFGVQFGDLRISLQSVLIALGVFAVGLLLTRFVQRWFIGRAFAGRQKDSGLQESTRIGLGYVGFVLSALAGMSYLGLDFSSLAIVAGALSVGIGFGLQSIVNNFVSGIIILVERPDQDRRLDRGQRVRGLGQEDQRALDRDRDHLPPIGDHPQRQPDHQPRDQLDARRSGPAASTFLSASPMAPTSICCARPCSRSPPRIGPCSSIRRRSCILPALATARWTSSCACSCATPGNGSRPRASCATPSSRP